MSGPNTNRVSGFTLIETLVAMVVLGVGLLGIASLYVVSLRAGSDAIYRVQAINLASDMADRMRANPKALASYAAGTSSTTACTQANPCTADQMAQYDLSLWQTELANQLPSGAATIQCVAMPCDTTPGNSVPVQISINWNDPKSQSVLNYTMSFSTLLPAT